MTIPKQQKLVEIACLIADMKHRAVGAAGELMAAILLERAGYEVRTANCGTRHRGDLTAVDKATGESFRVEVKTSRRSKDGRYHWRLRKHDRHGVTDIDDADYVLLLAVAVSGAVTPFVVPVKAFSGLKTFQFCTRPEDYAGRFAQYRQHGRHIQLGEST